MAMQFIASVIASDAASGTVLDTTTGLEIQAGDILIGIGRWNDNGTTDRYTLASGVNHATVIFPGTWPWYAGNALPFFLMECLADSGALFRMTVNSSATYRSLTILQFRPPANTKVDIYCDLNKFAGAYTDTASVSVGPFDTIGDDVLALALANNRSSLSISSTQIGGVASDGVVNNGLLTCWYKGLTSNASGIYATGTLSSAGEMDTYIVTLRATTKITAKSSIRVSTAQWGNDYVSIDSAPQNGTLVCGWCKSRPLTGAYPRNRGNLIVAHAEGTRVFLTGLTNNGGVTEAYIGNNFYNANTMLFGYDTENCYIGDYTAFGFGGTLTEEMFFGWQFYAMQYVLSGTTIYLRQWTKPGPGACFRYNEDTITIAQLRAGLVANGWTQTRADAWTPSDLSKILFGYENDANSEGTYYYDLTRLRVYARSTAPTLSELDAISMNPDADTTAWADWDFSWVSGAAVLTDRSGNSRTLSLQSGGTLYEGQTFTAGATAGQSGSAVDVSGAWKNLQDGKRVVGGAWKQLQRIQVVHNSAWCDLTE